MIIEIRLGFKILEINVSYFSVFTHLFIRLKLDKEGLLCQKSLIS